MFKFKGTNFFYVFLLALTFAVVSCDEDQLQEDITPITPTTEVQTQLNTAMARAMPPSSNSSADSLCFSFNYPLALALEDGTTVTVNDEEELNDAFLNADDSDNLVADFVYPLTLTLADGSETTVADFEAFIGVLVDCFGDFDDWGDDDDWDDGDHGDCPDDFDFAGECFTIVFPLTVSVNGADVTVDSEDAFTDLLTSFDGDTISEFEFVFPFSVFVLADSSTVEITSEEDLGAVLETCDFGDFDDWDDDFDFGFGTECFEINYPLNLTINGESVTFNSEEDLAAALGDLVQDESASIELEYPVSITLASDNSVVTINNDEEWTGALEDACDFDGGDWDDDDDNDWDPNEGYGCFELNFPFTLSINGEEVTISSEEDFATILLDLGDVEEIDIQLVYPVSVTIFSDSSTVTINNEEEWEALCDACHFDGGDGDFDDECYAVNFPLGIVVAGETVTVENEEDLGALFTEINPEDFGGFAFPLSVTITETGEVVTINNEEEFAGLDQYCD